MTKSESKGIGTENERSLHASIKKAISQPGDLFEIKIGNYIVDILRGDHIIEIQTTNFSSIKNKIRTLIINHPVTLVYPIPLIRQITYVSSDGSVLSSRKSPRKGAPEDVFRELIRIPEIIMDSNFSLEILMIREEEIRCDDGRGSWRRKGVSIVDRKLLEIVESIRFEEPACFKYFLPDELETPFTNRILADRLNRSIYDIRKMTYCLKKMGVLTESGRQGNEILMSSVFHFE